MRVRYTPRATQDLQDIFEYIRKENPFAGLRLVDGIQSVIAELGSTPGMGSPTDKGRIQRFPVAATPYLVFYEILEGEVAIVHIRHGAREPWAGPR